MVDYSAWLKKMEACIAALEKQGIRGVRVDVTPAEFVAWADARGCDYGSASRGSYAAFMVMQGQLVVPNVPPTRTYG